MDSFTKKGSSAPKKFTFTLEGIDIDLLNVRYGIAPSSKKPDYDVEKAGKFTRIKDIEKPAVVTFVDSSKRLHTCIVSAIDFTKRKPSGEHVYQCFWDRHTIPNGVVPLGVPIRYIPAKAIKKYYSEVSRDTYTITENITGKKKFLFQGGKDPRIEVVDGGFYETVDVVCSWNCMWAWIESNSHNSLYNDSKKLLLRQYNEERDEKVPEPVKAISPAPHWRVLKACGGELSIETFRENLESVVYDGHGHVHNLPTYRPIGTLYEKVMKF